MQIRLFMIHTTILIYMRCNLNDRSTRSGLVINPAPSLDLLRGLLYHIVLESHLPTSKLDRNQKAYLDSLNKDLDGCCVSSRGKCTYLWQESRTSVRFSYSDPDSL